MKKSFFFLCLLVIALSSCDPEYGVDYKLVNNSGHTVTFTSNPDCIDCFWVNHPDGITVESGQDSLFYILTDYGSANLSSAKGGLTQFGVYGDTIVYTFDNGKRLVYSREEGNGPFDFEGDHYIWTAKRDHRFILPYSYYGYLTYTITEEDYTQAE